MDPRSMVFSCNAAVRWSQLALKLQIAIGPATRKSLHGFHGPGYSENPFGNPHVLTCSGSIILFSYTIGSMFNPKARISIFKVYSSHI